MPVLFTVPVSVMRVVSSITPPYCVRGRFSKVFPFSAGLEVFINAIAYSPLRNYDDPLVPDVARNIDRCFKFRTGGWHRADPCSLATVHCSQCIAAPLAPAPGLFLLSRKASATRPTDIHDSSMY